MIIRFLVWVLFCFPLSAYADISCDTLTSSTTEADPQDVSYTVGTTLSLNRVVIAQADWRSEGGTITGVTFDGNAMTQIGTSSINTTPNPDVGVSSWVITGVSNGTYTVSANWSGVLALATVKVFTCYGVDQTTPVRVGSPANSDATLDTTVTVNVSSATGDLVVDSVGSGSSSPTQGAGQSLIGSCVSNNGTNYYSCASYESGSATTTMSYTTGVAANLVINAFSLQPADAEFGPLRRR